MAAAAGRAGLGLAGTGKVRIGAWGSRLWGESKWGSVERSGWGWGLQPPGKWGSRWCLLGVDPVGDPVRGSADAGKVEVQVGLGLIAVSSVYDYSEL